MTALARWAAAVLQVRVWLYVLMSSWLLLVLTGLYLGLFYHPTASAAYADMETLRSSVSTAAVVRIAHRIFGVLALLSTIGALASFVAVKQNRAAIASGVTVITAGAAVLTGYFLPWDQLALWSVTVGTNMRGFAPIFNETQVRYVLVGGTEISLQTFRFWFILHVLVMPLVMAGSVAIARTLSKRTRPSK